jgi:predicted RNA-binding Zn-ribbon protein involved in translation (DUF1610 family)
VNHEIFWRTARTKLTAMDVFEFTCSDCGPFTVVPVDEIRSRNNKTPLRCPDCNGPVSVDVLSNYEPPVRADAR